MKHRSWLALLALFAIVAAVWTAAVHAQTPPSCPYADIRLDTDQAVDVDAICNAAQPWADDGFQVFILLTDYRAESEEDWFAFLDRTEASVGIRDLSQSDSFNKSTLAFEASTASDLAWGFNVTFGERLFDSALDTDESLFRVQDQMRAAITAGDPTGAFVQALTTSYTITHPPPSPWLWVGIGVLAAGVLGAGGYLLTPRVIRPAIQRARRRTALGRHLRDLRANTSNLMTACDQLLRGDAPEETVLYQLFSAYGGEHRDDIQADVREWLRRSQEALNDAFDLRQKLLDPALLEKRPLEQRVQDWEMLYVTLVGNSERILTLTDDELRTLLDPMLVLDREAADVKLAEQLDGIRRELVGMPLRVELTMVDPAQTDAEGILGYIDQAKAQIARLQEEQREAPKRLAEARAQRQAANEDVPSPFVMTEKQLFAGIDERLAQANDTLEQGLFFRVIEQATGVVRDIEIVRAFTAAVSDHNRRQAEVDAVTDQGYRPPRLTRDLREVESDIRTITEEILAGDYVAAASWIDELNTDSQRALVRAQRWRALHEENMAARRRLSDEVARVERTWMHKATSAWETLQTYPKGNWGDVADPMAQARQTLHDLRNDRVSQVERLNSIKEQKFTKAEQVLTQACANLTQTEQQLQAVVNRLAEVQSAEANIREALRLTEVDVARAAALRDQEDLKIGPEVDQQIEEAGRQLAEGQRLTEAREFVAAANAQTTARQLATAAYATASEQAQEICALQEELEKRAREAEEQVDHCLAEAKAMPAVVQTTGTGELVRQVADDFSTAQQTHITSSGLEDYALAESLRAAMAAYREVGQLADQAMQHLAADRDAYDTCLTEARNAIRAARAAMRKAEQVRRDPNVGGSGKRALKQAKDTLPPINSIENATKEALIRIRHEAEEAQRHAEKAERLAREKIRKARPKRKAKRQRRKAKQRRQSTTASPKLPSSRGLLRPTISKASSGRTSSKVSPKRRGFKASAKKTTSATSSRRTSSRSTSRRSSSRGSSRRSSSMGSSRRRSSTGRRRRRG